MTQQALVSKIPDHNVLLTLEPEELAWVVLESLKAQAGDTQNRSENKLNMDNFIHAETVQGYPQDSHQAILKALQTGPLSDRTAPEGERQALSDLFAGAVGSYKNPSSHRHVAIDPPETGEMIMLASHLLKIVDSRTMTTTSPP